ncbi:MAG: HAD family hydrolase [Thermoproteota archaeon]
MSRLLQRVRCVSFDVWNTLLDLPAAYNVFINELSAATGSPRSRVERALREAGAAIRRVRAQGGHVDPSEAQRTLADHLDASVEAVRRAVALAFARLRSGIASASARRVLADVRALGLKVAVASNVMWWPGSYTRLVLAREGIVEMLDAAIFADEAGYSKPNPHFFAAVADALGCSVAELLHVGDRVDEDFGVALAAGAYAVLVGSVTRGPVEVHPRAYAVEKLEEVVEVVRRLAGR